jgi:hypothetical protein
MKKSMKLGGGGRFAKGQSALEKKGYSATSAGAIMAKAGRKKYGEKKMAKMSVGGRHKAITAHVQKLRDK